MDRQIRGVAESSFRCGSKAWSASVWRPLFGTSGNDRWLRATIAFDVSRGKPPQREVRGCSSNGVSENSVRGGVKAKKHSDLLARQVRLLTPRTNSLQNLLMDEVNRLFYRVRVRLNPVMSRLLRHSRGSDRQN